MVVTAQKREQNLQDVPVSVAVVTGKELISTNTLDFEGMADRIPSLGITNVANITAISIRGIGTTDNGGFEQSVGLFIDGIHQPKDRLYRATSFLDVANVQVLRGPQGTLFGKNTTGGALMLTSNRPTSEFEAGVTGSYIFDDGEGGHNGGYTTEGFVSGGLGDTFSARLALRQVEDHGYFTNVLNTGSEDVDDKEQQAGRLSLMWQPSDTLSALLKFEKGRSRIDGEPNRTVNYRTAFSPGLGGLTPQALVAIAGASPVVEGKYLQSWNTGKDDTDTNAATLTMEWDVSDFTLMSISGYTDFDYDQHRDADWTAADLLSQDDTQDFEAYSQEFRLVSPLGEKVEYVAGIYYQSSSDHSIEQRNYNVSLIGLPPAVSSRAFSSDNESVSVYANFDFHLADAWTLSLGGNYSDESKDAERMLTIAGNATVAAIVAGDYAHDMSGDRSVDKFNSSAKLQYDLSDDFMLYTSVSQSFKSGGFDEQGVNGDEPGEYPANAGPAQFEFDDEEVVSAEIGGKGMFLDGRLMANWAAFYVEVTDRQFSRFVPLTGFIVGNSGETSYQGMEFESQFLITENLQWDLSLAYLTGDIDEPIVAGTLQLETKGPIDSIPQWGATNHVGYQYPVGDLRITADMYNIFEDNLDYTGIALSRDSSLRTNLRLGLGDQAGVWEAALLVDNVTDEEVFIAAQVNAVFTDSAAGPMTAGEAWMRPPRTYTLQFRYNWD